MVDTFHLQALYRGLTAAIVALLEECVVFIREQSNISCIQL